LGQLLAPRGPLRGRLHFFISLLYWRASTLKNSHFTTLLGAPARLCRWYDTVWHLPKWEWFSFAFRNSRAGGVLSLCLFKKWL